MRVLPSAPDHRLHVLQGPYCEDQLPRAVALRSQSGHREVRLGLSIYELYRWGLKHVARRPLTFLAGFTKSRMRRELEPEG